MPDLDYLRLLAADADVAEFDEPVRRARESGVDAEVLRHLETARSVALTVRSTLHSRRRRETELTALYDTASDLAALHDVDAVLQSIFRRARALIGADVTYLTLNDPQRGDTYMRVTDGSVSAWFQRLRLPLGSGLGGLVAQRATPYTTANYLTDPRFRHTDDISGAVVEEGLVAILGVPLRRGATVIGVLYAANRSERPFRRDEAALLGSLATHAGIAIDNARLMEEAQEALADLNVATQQAVARGEAVERAAAAHERLTDIVASGGGLDDVARAVAEVLGGTVGILDAEGHALAGPGEPAADGLAAFAALDGRRCATPTAGGWRRSAPVRSGSACSFSGLPGSWIRPTDASWSGRARSRLCCCCSAARSPRHRLRCVAISSPTCSTLIITIPPPSWNAPGCSASTWSPTMRSSPRRGGRRRTPTAHAARQSTRQPPRRAGRGAGGADRGDPAGDGRRRCGHPGQRGTWHRGPCAGHRRRGRRARGHRTDAVHSRGVSGSACVPVGAAGAGSAWQRSDSRRTRFSRPAAGRRTGTSRHVRGFHAGADACLRRGSAHDLLTTLAAWFANDRSMAATQRQLHVHVNTVRQRLERIAALLGPGWDDPDRLLQLQLAIQVHRMRLPT